jgi:hypothetical protein
VEKNGGCNLVACICGQAFWWDIIYCFNIYVLHTNTVCCQLLMRYCYIDTLFYFT